LRTKSTLIVLAVAVVAVAVLLGAAYFWPGERVALLQERLSPSQTILTDTRADRMAVNLGDAFWYYVEVWYNPNRVAQIDRTSLDQQVNLQPFEVRSTSERDYSVSPGTRVYEKGYQLQFISGNLNQLYTFPAIAVRYHSQDGADLTDQTVVPQGVFVAARMPAEPDSFAFRPVASTVLDVPQARRPWIFWALGGILLALGLVNLALRHGETWPMAHSGERRAADPGVLAEAYRTLNENVRRGADPALVLHQVDHIVRLLLARQEQVDWLAEPGSGSAPASQMPAVAALLVKCERAYADEPIEPAEAAAAVADLKQILAGYFGREEVAAWVA
jgi:hypothetical protein